MNVTSADRRTSSSALRRALCATLLGAVLFTGCNNRPEPIAPATGTPAQIFAEEQADVVTPHGAIDLATVEDTDSGRVRYRTVGGELFEVEMETAADGTHRWVNSREIAEPR